MTMRHADAGKLAVWLAKRAYCTICKPFQDIVAFFIHYFVFVPMCSDAHVFFAHVFGLCLAFIFIKCIHIQYNLCRQWSLCFYIYLFITGMFMVLCFHMYFLITDVHTSMKLCPCFHSTFFMLLFLYFHQLIFCWAWLINHSYHSNKSFLFHLTLV